MTPPIPTSTSSVNHVTVQSNNLYKKSQEDIIFEINRRLSTLELKCDNLSIKNDQLEKINQNLLLKIATLESNENLNLSLLVLKSFSLSFLI